MYTLKILILLLLIYIIYKDKNNYEKFTPAEITDMSKKIYKNRELFEPNVKYSLIKKKIKKIDPVIYDDVYKLSLDKNLTISNLEKTIYNSIK